MSQKRKSRARPRSLGKKLTPKQAAFLRHYTDSKGKGFGNATRACELGGYKGDPGSNQLAVQGHRNLQNPNVQEAVSIEFEKQGFTPKFYVKLMMDAMRATKVQVVPTSKGKRVLKLPDHSTRLQGFDRALRVVGGNKPGPEREPWSEDAMDEAAAQLRIVPFSRIKRSEEDKRLLAEMESFSPEDRAAMRKGYTAIVRLCELAVQNGENPSDVLKDLREKNTPKPEAASPSSQVETAQPPPPADE